MPRRKTRTRTTRSVRGNRRSANRRITPAADAGEAPQPPRKGGRSRGLLRKAGRLTLRLVVAGGVAWGAMAGVEHGYDYATSSPRFEARALVYEATAHVDDDRLRSLMGLTPGTNILSLELDDLAERVAADPWVARASVVRELPDTLIVQVEEHEPRAVLLAGDFYLLNGDGQPFKRMDRGERGRLPVITGVDRATLFGHPDRARDRIQRALAVLESYRSEHRPALSEIHMGADLEVILYTADRGTQLRLGRGEVDAALARYDALRAALGPRTEELAVVHLDSSLRDDEPERIVASFFDPAEGQNLELEADAGTDPTTDPTAGKKPKRKRPDWRKDGPRIPRYD